MILTRKIKDLGENPAPVRLCLPHIPHGLTRARTRVSVKLSFSELIFSLVIYFTILAICEYGNLLGFTPFSLVEVDRCFRFTYCVHKQGNGKVVIHSPDDGGSNHLRNVGQILRDYTAQYFRRLPSS
jgi:hypothetical protein